MERTAPRRVLSPATPIPGQSLIGLVRECAWENRLPSVGVLLRDTVDAAYAWGDLAVRTDVDAAGLAYAMRIEAAEVAERMCPERRVARNLGIRFFHGAAIRAYDLGSATRSFAPASLETSGHHRAMWQHGLLPFCLESGETLVHRCLRCEKRLEWGAAKPLTRCSHCGRPAAVTPRRVAPVVLEAGRFLFGSADPRPAERAAAASRLHPDLSMLPPGVASDLGWSLGRLACEIDLGPRAHDRLLPAATRIEVILAGADLLAGWPDSVPACLRDALARDQSRARRMHHMIKTLCSPLACWPEQRDLLNRRLPEVLGTTRLAFRSARGNTLTSAETLLFLRVSWSMIPKLVQAGELTAVGARRGIKLSAVFDGTSVRRLADLRRDCSSIGNVSESFGISHEGLDQLIASHVLAEHEGPAVDIMYSQRQVATTSLLCLIERLENPVGSWKGESVSVSLSRAACSIGGGAKPWAAIFRALLEGDLPYCLARPHADAPGPPGRATVPRLVDRLFVDQAAFSRLAFAAVASSTHRAGGAVEEISRRDAEEMLNLTPANLIRTIKSELSSAALANGRLLRRDVARLARTSIAPAEISVRFAAGSRRLPPEIRKAGIERLGASGWPRHLVEIALAGRDAP